MTVAIVACVQPDSSGVSASSGRGGATALSPLSSARRCCGAGATDAAGATGAFSKSATRKVAGGTGALPACSGASRAAVSATASEMVRARVRAREGTEGVSFPDRGACSVSPGGAMLRGMKGSSCPEAGVSGAGGLSCALAEGKGDGSTGGTSV